MRAKKKVAKKRMLASGKGKAKDITKEVVATGHVSLAVPAGVAPVDLTPALPVVDIVALDGLARERYLGVADWIIDRQLLCNERDLAQRGIDALTSQIRAGLGALGIGGLVTANYKAVVVTSKGRSSISAQKLLEKGVDPVVIEEATVVGAPTVSLRVTELGGGKRKSGDADTALAEAAGA